MAKYRQVHITFWQDPFVEGLNPLEKYFYLYLMTNSKTTQCGCYETSMKLIKYETGLNQKQVDDFIKLLVDNGKIEFNKENNEFILINWLKHNSFKSPKVRKCIDDEINNIKTNEFKDYLYYILDEEYPIYRLSIDYPKTMDRGSQQEQKEEEEEEEEEEEQKNISVYDYWNSKNIYKHNSLTKSIGKALDKLPLKNQDDVKQAIDRYEKAYNDKSYFYNHCWTLDKFITQSNGYKEWLEEGSLWVAYTQKTGKGLKPKEKKVFEVVHVGV